MPRRRQRGHSHSHTQTHTRPGSSSRTQPTTFRITEHLSTFEHAGWLLGHTTQPASHFTLRDLVGSCEALGKPRVQQGATGRQAPSNDKRGKKDEGSGEWRTQPPSSQPRGELTRRALVPLPPPPPPPPDSHTHPEAGCQAPQEV